MSWDDFTRCMADCGQEVVDALSKVGEAGADAIKQIVHAWGMLPAEVRAFIVEGARYGVTYLVAALASAGIATGDVLETIAAAAIAVGVALFMTALVTCSVSL